MADSHVQVVKEAAVLVVAAAERWRSALSELMVEELFPLLLRRLVEKNHAVQQTVSDATTVVYARCCRLSQILDLLSASLNNHNDLVREQTATWLWWALQKCTRDFREEPWAFEHLARLLVKLTGDRSKGCRDVACLALAQIVAAFASFGADLEIYNAVTGVIAGTESSDQIAFMAQSIEIDTEAPDLDLSLNSSQHTTTLLPPKEAEEEQEEDAANHNREDDLHDDTQGDEDDVSPRASAEQEVEVAVIVKLHNLETGTEQDLEASVSISPESPITTVVDDILVHIEENLYPGQDVRVASLFEQTSQSELNAAFSVGYYIEKLGKLTLQMEVHVGKDLAVLRDQESFSSGDELLQSMLISYEEEGRGGGINQSDDAMSIVTFTEQSLLETSQQLDMELKSLIISDEDAKGILPQLRTPGIEMRESEAEASQLLEECISMFGGESKGEDIIFSPGWTASDEAMITFIAPPSDEKTRKRLQHLRESRDPDRNVRGKINLADRFDNADSPEGVGLKIGGIPESESAAVNGNDQVDSSAPTPILRTSRSANRSLFGRARNVSGFQSPSRKDIIESLERELQQDSEETNGPAPAFQERAVSFDPAADLPSDGSVGSLSSKDSHRRRRQTFSTADFNKLTSNIQQALDCLTPKDVLQQKRRLTSSGFLPKQNNGSNQSAPESQSPEMQHSHFNFDENDNGDDDGSIHRRSRRLSRSAKLVRHISRSKSRGSVRSESPSSNPPRIHYNQETFAEPSKPPSPSQRSGTSSITMDYSYDSDEDYENLRVCLDRLHLAKHYHIFRENQVTLEVLENLTEEEMAEMGLPLGARKRIIVFRDEGRLLVTSGKSALPPDLRNRKSMPSDSAHHELTPSRRSLPPSNSHGRIQRQRPPTSASKMPPPPPQPQRQTTGATNRTF